MIEAAILAAGLGSRLGRGEPKCMTELCGRPLLAHLLDGLAAAGIEDATVVVGHRAEAIETWLASAPRPLRVRTCRNPEYTGPSVVSLHTAIRATRGALLVIESDLMLHPAIVGDLVADPHDNVVPAGPPCNVLPFGVTTDADGRVLRWGYDPATTDELIGLYKLSRQSLDRLLAVPDGNYWDRLPELAAPLWARRCTHPWSEIDTPEDLARARAVWERRS